jgi:hypothetical protein
MVGILVQTLCTLHHMYSSMTRVFKALRSLITLRAFLTDEDICIVTLSLLRLTSHFRRQDFVTTGLVLKILILYGERGGAMRRNETVSILKLYFETAVSKLKFYHAYFARPVTSKTNFSERH